jgi:ArsR family transcriptional regulator
VQISEFTKALAHPARVEILETLARKEVCLCREIVADLPLAQSTVSMHLKELKKSGIIDFEIDGVKSFYSINWVKLEAHFSLVNKFAKKLKKIAD